MSDTLRRVIIDILVIAVLAAAYLGYRQYREYQIIRMLTYEMACASNPTVATRLGAPCLPPANATAPTASLEPAVPAVVPEKPGENKK